MSNKLTAGQLIAALEQGKDLQKDYKLAFPENYEYHESGEFIQGFRMYSSNGRKYFERWGWGSALGKEQEVLAEIVQHPERWTIKGESQPVSESEPKGDEWVKKDDAISFGKFCFYKGFDKSENDDANCYTAWMEEAGKLINNHLKCKV